MSQVTSLLPLLALLLHPAAGWLLAALLVLAQLAKAVADAQAHGSPRLLAWFPRWAGPESWRLKYRNGDQAQGPRFWLSTTLLVAFTDLWHFANLVMWLGWAGACLLAVVSSLPLGLVACLVVGAKFVFEPVYAWLRRP